jgi:DNA-directed RNA polymerase II subunit RPB2
VQTPPPLSTLQFGQIFVSKPLVTEADGLTDPLFPREARLRNLT